ncbi:hypothetical protein, partial [Helicobacter pullorum]|uniref:hypothetical protein n=1 Tax=Helicobacter pullorum TaxID=35818 RepID=UPI001F1CE80B
HFASLGGKSIKLILTALDFKLNFVFLIKFRYDTAKSDKGIRWQRKKHKFLNVSIVDSKAQNGLVNALIVELGRAFWS